MIEAVKSGDAGMVQALLAADPAAVEAADADGVTAVMWAVYIGNVDLAREIAFRKQNLSLVEAAAIGEEEKVAALIEAGASVNAISPDGFSPLGFAAKFGHPEVASELLSRGANANAISQNPMKVAPLHSALAGGHVSIARMLLEAGADPAAVNGEGWTPLHYVAELGDAEVAKLLLEQGATPYVQNHSGQSPSDLAVKAGHHDVADAMRWHMHRQQEARKAKGEVAIQLKGLADDLEDEKQKMASEGGNSRNEPD